MPPQLARQLATLDQMMGGRLTVNIISSDVPGEELASGPRYRRSTEIMFVLRELLDGAATHGGLAPFASLPCPVRVAWSGRDRLIPWRRHGVTLRERLPGAEFVRLPRVGHVPMWDDPDLVVRTVLGVTTAHPSVCEETSA